MCGHGKRRTEASLPGEYVIHEESARFLDYTEKYSSTGNVEFVVPAEFRKPDEENSDDGRHRLQGDRRFGIVSR